MRTWPRSIATTCIALASHRPACTYPPGATPATCNNVLEVGSGDFSFAASMMRAGQTHGSWLATTIDDQDDMAAHYPSSAVQIQDFER